MLIKTYSPVCTGRSRRGIYRVVALPAGSPRATVMDCQAVSVNQARKIFLQKYGMWRGEIFIDFLKDTP